MVMSNENENSVTRELLIQNQTGLHARPAAAFVKTANGYRSEIIVRKGEDSVNGKSIIALLTLAASRGTKLVVEATGEDAEMAVDAIQALVDSKFNEA
jgi:phosphotransferase system HPr (HPr) family protein|tara:strand:+ start:201 stop:494 length:294 start_codon:yes stop_codon:yes gene_type:complete